VPFATSPTYVGAPVDGYRSIQTSSDKYLFQSSSIDSGDHSSYQSNSSKHSLNSTNMYHQHRINTYPPEIPEHASVAPHRDGVVALKPMPKTARAAAAELYEIRQAEKTRVKIMVKEIKKQLPAKNIQKKLVVERPLESRATGRAVHVETDDEMLIEWCQLDKDRQKDAARKALRMVEDVGDNPMGAASFV